MHITNTNDSPWDTTIIKKGTTGQTFKWHSKHLHLESNLHINSRCHLKQATASSFDKFNYLDAYKIPSDKDPFSLSKHPFPTSLQFVTAEHFLYRYRDILGRTWPIGSQMSVPTVRGAR